MYCPQCGDPNVATHKFCVTCGNALPQVNSTTSTMPASRGAQSIDTTPIGPVTAPVSRLKLSRGMVVSASLILIVCFFNPLIACSAPFAGGIELSGLDIVLAGITGGEFERGNLLWALFALIPIIAVRLLMRTWHVVQRGFEAREEGYGIPGLVIIGVLLVLLWAVVRISNITVAGYQLTGYYRSMWLALALAGGGFYLERQESADRFRARSISIKPARQRP